MSAKRTSIHGQWSSRWAFYLAATGSAVGLGNIWRFPYMAGESGGGAFLLLYVVCVLIMGIPIMMAEILLGRRGRQSPVNTMRVLAEEEGFTRQWQWLGIMGVVAGFLIVSYYSVIAGWVLAYVFRAATGSFAGGDPEMIGKIFSDLTADPERMLAWHTVFIIMTVMVVSRGVKSGLEKAVTFLMPALVILLLVMVGYAMSTERFAEGLIFILKPDFSAMQEDFQTVFLNASGHAFFSLSLGMGAIMIYGSYLSDRTSITSAAIVIASADTLIAILASLAIYPLVFTYGLEPAQGPGLIFVTLPIAFGQMPGGAIFGTLFFLLLTFAAWTSAISLIEPAVTWLVENWSLSRVKATVYTGILAWFLGIATILSFNHWAFSFSFAGTQKENGIFDIIDLATANVMLPLGGFLMAIFAGWLMSRASSMDALKLKGKLYATWRFVIRYLSPIGVTIIFLNMIGVI
jgi:neurotransmitter:Na+ symporter, NSS family